MANNERVSQLTDLLASDLQSGDLFLITDMSQRESKKLELGQLLLFIENSGSFYAYHATISDTASYVLANNISGTVGVANYASQSISSSWSFKSVSSSYADNSNSSSYSSFCVNTLSQADSASFLIYTGTPNGTASYAINANTANTATTAINLFYNGTANGTASYAMAAQSSSFSLSSSFATTAINSTNAAVSITSSISSYAATTTFADTASLAYTALTASSLSVNIGPKFITPIVIKSTTSATSWSLYQCPVETIPIGTTTVILDAWSSNGSTNTAGFVEIASQAANTSSAYYILIGYRSAGSGDSNTWGGQGTFPMSSSSANSSSFYYIFTQAADAGTTLRLIGYY